MSQDEITDGPTLSTEAEAISAAIARAEVALAILKQSLVEGDLADLGEKAAAAASTLYRESRAFIASSETIAETRSELRGTIRRNPLAAVGAAFVGGMLLALLTRN